METVFKKQLPDYPDFTDEIRRAPDRGYKLTCSQTEIALKIVTANSKDYYITMPYIVSDDIIKSIENLVNN